MTNLEKAKAVAAYMNEHPEGSLEEWNAFAESQGMIKFEYSDDDWYRNEDYVVSRIAGKYDVNTIDRYDIERKTLWKVCLDGEPDTKWVNSLSEAIDRAKEIVLVKEKDGIEADLNHISFVKKLF